MDEGLDVDAVTTSLTIVRTEVSRPNEVVFTDEQETGEPYIVVSAAISSSFVVELVTYKPNSFDVESNKVDAENAD